MSNRNQSKFAFAALLLLTLTSAVTSASDNETYEKWISFFEGNWSWSSDTGMVGEIKFDRADKEVPALFTKFKMAKPSQGSALAFKGWDNASKMIVETGYNSSGASHQTKYKIISESKLEGSWVSTEADGTIKKTKFTLRRVNDDTYVLEDPKFIENGDDSPWTKITLRRKK